MKKYKVIARKKILTSSGNILDDAELKKINALVTEDIELDDDDEGKDINIKFYKLHPECNGSEWHLEIL
ncbi:MAG: hypothetical protein LKE61_09150 [Erysipelotrichaceae bacterium]|jgi:hypothetical protein|nr:hypothetical protein [Erysipelotrichaceae bacterium]MCH4043979.1 hypothetical protein [Erysipelotrichaceae bacterium]MCH4121194.1 hypothetical protein [Erysipelotrichaceae bacterium]